MTELKTLKDLGVFSDRVSWTQGDIKHLFEEEELKQEAIKWVKVYNYNLRHGAQMDYGMFDFCKKFFNLTEEDLIP